MDRIEDAKQDWMRRGWVPQPVGRGNLAPTMRAGHRIWVLLVRLAPEGRHVYSTHGIHKYLKPQRGDRCSLSESQIRPIQPKTPIKKT